MAFSDEVIDNEDNASLKLIRRDTPHYTKRARIHSKHFRSSLGCVGENSSSGVSLGPFSSVRKNIKRLSLPRLRLFVFLKDRVFHWPGWNSGSLFCYFNVFAVWSFWMLQHLSLLQYLNPSGYKCGAIYKYGKYPLQDSLLRWNRKNDLHTSWEIDFTYTHTKVKTMWDRSLF